MKVVTLWGYEIQRAWLSHDEADYLESLPCTLPPVEWVWQEMDRVWLGYGLDNSLPLNEQPVKAFYSHPVWLMNGVFTQVDPVSSTHRSSIATYLANENMRRIADFGGGFGGLAVSMAHAIPDARVDIIEPYPSGVTIERIRQEMQVSIRPELHSDSSYDAVVAQDVLEHVEDPVGLSAQLAGAVRENGLVVFANCFHPFILCHLPSTFHLRHTFPQVMGALGLRYLGTVAGAGHVQVFRRSGRLSLERARFAERVSRLVGPALNITGAMVTRIRH